MDYRCENNCGLFYIVVNSFDQRKLFIGIQGNVRMLGRMLKHPNLYQSMATVTLDRVQPAYEPQPSKHADAMLIVRERKQRQLTTKQNQLADHLKDMRNR